MPLWHKFTCALVTSAPRANAGLAAVTNPAPPNIQRGGEPVKKKSKKTKVTSQSKLNRRIAEEAKSLGMSRSEYLRLTLALSKSLREALQKETNIDPVALLTFVESPLFSVLLQSLVQTAVSSLKPGDDEKDSTSQSPQQSTNQPQAPAVRPQQPMYPRPAPGFQPPYPPTGQYAPMRPMQQQPGRPHTEHVSPAPARPAQAYSFWP